MIVPNFGGEVTEHSAHKAPETRYNPNIVLEFVFLAACAPLLLRPSVEAFLCCAEPREMSTM